MRFKILRSLPAALLVAAAACSSGDKPHAPSTPPAGAQHVDAATAGSIVGRVTFEGSPPENPPVKISGDPNCARANPNGLAFENYIVENGGLDNVFVRVKDGLGDYAFDAPAESVKLDQQGCRYVPHVVGVRVGQPVEISNSDETTHNIHSLPDMNREFNLAQYQKGQKNVETFTVSEVMIPLKCDLHSWMRAYIGVVEHPYFAVTTGGGKFELKNLPPGTYTVEAWHEKAGTQTQRVTVGEKETKEIGFTYKTTSAN
jgi:plastocyanin